MSVVVRYNPAGLTQEVYDKASSNVQGGEWPPDGLDMHVCFGDDGDLKVSEIWDSEQQWRSFTEQLLPKLEEAGVQMGGEPQVFEVHGYEKR
jgi:hypothetical protein